MKRTPDSVSQERQKIGRERAAWEAKIKESRESLQITPASRALVKKQIEYYEQQLKECRKRMAALRHRGRSMWVYKSK